MEILSIVSSNVYRSVVLAATMVIAVAIFSLSLEPHRQHDFTPDVKPITPALYTQWGQYANVIDFGMYILDFVVQDYSESKFLIDMELWLVFNPLVVSIETAQAFSFDAGQIIERRLVDAKRIYDKLYLRYMVRCEFISPLNYKDYPLDAHRIQLIMKLDEMAPWEIILKSTYSRTVFYEGALPYNWRSIRTPEIAYGYYEAILDIRTENNIDYTPVAAVFFDIKRADFREAILIFLPLMFLLFIVFGSLLLTATSMQSLIIALMSIVAMIIYRLIIAGMSPATTYYMLSDLVFLLVFLCALIIIAGECINAIYKQENTLWFDVMRSATLSLACMVFLGGWFYLLYIW